MKRFYIAVILLFAISSVDGQTVTTTTAEKIALKMKDSLSLSENQKKNVYGINLQLEQQKKNARKLFTDMDLLSIKFQVIEDTRDSLYRIEIGEEKFKQYQLKKQNLVNNN